MPASSDLATPRPWETLAPGTQWRGLVETGIPQMPPIPVLAARGAAEGPRLTVFGAVHGDEYEGPAAIHALFDALTDDDLAELGGLCVGVPVANPAAWAARIRTTPHDGKDLNRCFPGDDTTQATPSQRLAHFLFQTFVLPTQVLIDLHSGGLRLEHLPLMGWGQSGTESAMPQASAQQAEALARIFGFDFYPWQVGTTAGVLTHEATRAGKIALGAEWGGGARLDPAGMGAYAHGIGQVWRALSTAPPWSYELDPRPPLVGAYEMAPVTGLFHPAVALGQEVHEGEPLGTVVDDLGQEIATLTSPRAGLVAGLAHIGRIVAGEPYIYIGAQIPQDEILQDDKEIS